MDPDRELVRRAQRGDRVAFELLVERHQHRLFTLAARLLGSVDDAADAVQETLVRAWLALPRFRGEARFSTWLYRICLNSVHDQRVRASPRELSPERDPSDLADERDAFAERELAGELQRALAEVSDVYRLPLVLYDVLGCSYAEISSLLEIAEGTVKSRIFRGRREVARGLGTARAPTESKSR